jgi:DNA polymerase-3 subunit alpha
MAFAVLEDMTSKVEIVVFPNTFSNCSHLLATDEPVVVLGQVQHGERGVKIIAESVDTLSMALEKYTQDVDIRIRAHSTSRRHLEKIKEILYQHHGTCPVRLTLHFDGRGEVDIEILKDLKVKPSAGFFRQIEGVLGYHSLEVRMREPEIENRSRNGYSNYNKKTVH